MRVDVAVPSRASRVAMLLNSISDWARPSDAKLETLGEMDIGRAAALLLLLALLLFTPPGLRLVGSMVRPLSGGAVTVERLSGTFPNRLRAASVEIADAQGAWLRLTDIALDWSAFSALRNHIKVRDVTAARIAVLRRPVASEAEGGETPRIDVAHFRFGRIDIHAPVIGRQVALTAQGALEYTSRHQLSADVAASRLDNGDRYRIAGGIAQDVAQGAYRHPRKGPDGILGDLAGLPGLGRCKSASACRWRQNAPTPCPLR